MGVKGLQKRVRRLELARSPRSPIECLFGSLEVFEAWVQAEIDAGKTCRFDGPLVLNAIRRWHREGLFGAWRRQGNQVWEYYGR